MSLKKKNSYLPITPKKQNIMFFAVVYNPVVFSKLKNSLAVSGMRDFTTQFIVIITNYLNGQLQML
jgi:hypothetical protein